MASDPRLITLYDDDNPDGPDHDHARALAEELGARTIVDLGCGTGQLAVTLAQTGRTVIGVDPDTTAIEYARRRAGGEAVIWTSGDSTVMGDLAADLIVLTGNSVQHIAESDWSRTLARHRPDPARGWRAAVRHPQSRRPGLGTVDGRPGPPDPHRSATSPSGSTSTTRIRMARCTWTFTPCSSPPVST